jgi:hypothetical protein
MNPPHNRTGRPRRRPYAAHDARAVKLRAENARRWLQELRWRIDAEPEVMRDLYVERKADITYLYGQGPILVDVLDRIINHLADDGSSGHLVPRHGD